MGLDKKNNNNKKIIKDFITEEYKDYIYICSKGMKAD